VAKTSGKKPAAVQSKRVQSAGPMRSNGRKQQPVSSVRAAIRPVKKTLVPAKAVERPVVKSSAKPAAAARVPEKKVAPAPAPVEPAKPIAVKPPKQAQAPRETASARPEVKSSAPTENAKPRKPNAGLTSRELENFRELLLSKRRELIGDMSSMEREALRTGGGSNLSNLPIHMADMGTDNYEQEFTLGLVQKDRDLLKEINLALSKMQNGTYGYCEGTGEPILKERLEFQPWAKYSVEYQKKLERHGR